MLQDRVSNPGPLTYESGAVPIALRGLAILFLELRDRDVSCPRVTVSLQFSES